jgi:aryl-alcohol dehydrogenase-like predicted oxidoreductase
MLHEATPEILRNETILNRFVKIREEGKARSIGISTYTFAETLQGIESGIWDVIQLPFNLLDQQQRICFKLAGKAGIGIVARSVLFRGMLSGDSLNLHPALKEVQNHIEQYEKLLMKSWSTLPTLATKFVLSYQEISSVLIGIDKMEYLHNAIEAADGNYPQGKILSNFESMQFPNQEFLNIHQWVKNGWLI